MPAQQIYENFKCCVDAYKSKRPKLLMEAALIKSPKKSVWMPLYQSGVSASCAYKII